MTTVIGMDPHKRSATIEVVDGQGTVVAGGRFGADSAGYADMLRTGRGFPGRVWAVEGCDGIARHQEVDAVHGTTLFTTRRL